ncbi:MAG: phospholipase D-like domain-containing protein [Bacteroidales bacterium]|nr:phospholipase D-like domain-containing protein [Bacteroidales bacterium]
MVTPYYKPWKLLERALDKAASLQKKIIFIFRYDEPNPNNKRELMEFKRMQNLAKELNQKGFDIHFIERLHTKLYCNERTAVLTSMNLFDSSAENNYEVGYKFDSIVDAKRFKETVIEKDILGLIPKLTLIGRYGEELKRKEAEKMEKERLLAANKPNYNTNGNTKQNDGYCIRCHTDISYDPNHPYCLKHFQSWNYHNDANFPEKYCHRCGKEHITSMSKPLCYDCFTTK